MRQKKQFSRVEGDVILEVINNCNMGLYRDNGKDNGNYYGILYKGDSVNRPMASTEWRTDQSIEVEPIECSAERCLKGSGAMNIGKVGCTLGGDRLLLSRSIADSAWSKS